MFKHHKTKAHSGQEMCDLKRYEGQRRPTPMETRTCLTRETRQLLLDLVLTSSCSFSRVILPVDKYLEYFCQGCKFNTVTSLIDFVPDVVNKLAYIFMIKVSRVVCFIQHM